MNQRSQYPHGSPRDVLIRVRRVEREVRRILRDVRSVNDNNPNFVDQPMDVGRYIVQLKKIRGVIAEIRRVITSGAEKLPNGILDPINEKW